VQYCIDNGLAIPREVAFELPRESAEFDGRIAYLRFPSHASACDGRGRWTVAKAGAYLHRHFPAIPGHTIEMILGKTKCSGLEILTDAAMVAVMHPERCHAHSCMVGEWSPEDHPYRAYSSRLGWSLAVVKGADGRVTGRALLNNNEYVRIFGQAKAPGQIQGDHAGMRSLLIDAGYRATDGWSGRKIEAIKRGGRFIGPYLDGEIIGGDYNGQEFELCEHDYEYEFHSTSGFAEDSHADDIEDIHGDYIPEDEAVWSNHHDGYIRQDDAVRLANGEYVESDLAVCCADGRYRLSDDCVEVNGDYYDSDSDDIVYSEHEGEYILIDDAVCLEDGDYCLSSDAVRLDDGEYILADDAVEIDGIWMRDDDPRACVTSGNESEVV
jgi:hypothetical protein